MFPTGLSMLWESTDPLKALETRFGFHGFDDAVSRLSTVLATDWGIDVQACDRILISDTNAIAWVRTGHETLVAKWSCDQSRFARLSDIADLLQALDRHGVPVPPPRASADGRHRVVVDSGSSPLSMLVQPHIDGDLLDIADETAVRRAGACLASLHRALAVQRGSRLVEVGSPVDPRQRIETWLDRRDAGRAPAASAGLREQMASLPAIDSPPQLIHGDYRASNILTADSDVLAVIDFDGVAWDHCVTDIANSCVRLGTHFTDWRPTPASVRATFVDGYRSVRPLTRLEHQWLQVIVLWYGIAAIPAGDDPAGWASAL